MTLMRLKKIAVIALQETKLSEKDKETIEKENPGLALKSNPNDRRAGAAFAINKDIIRWDASVEKPWKHETIERGRILKLHLEWNDYTMTVYAQYKTR